MKAITVLLMTVLSLTMAMPMSIPGVKQVKRSAKHAAAASVDGAYQDLPVGMPLEDELGALKKRQGHNVIGDNAGYILEDEATSGKMM
ncbi:hypothetical protein VKS41_006935 [Umbelopsis sp. WA50703]|jgi:hypothetical protein